MCIWDRKNNSGFHSLWDFRLSIRDFDSEACFHPFFLHFIHVSPAPPPASVSGRFSFIEHTERKEHKSYITAIWWRFTKWVHAWTHHQDQDLYNNLYNITGASEIYTTSLFSHYTWQFNHSSDLCHHKGGGGGGRGGLFLNFLQMQISVMCLFMPGFLCSVFWYWDLLMLHVGIFASFISVWYPML